MLEEEGYFRPHMFVAPGTLRDGGCSGYLLGLSRMGKRERDMKRDVTPRQSALKPRSRSNGSLVLLRSTRQDHQGIQAS